MKTYKQLAEELGISKDQIKYRARFVPGEELVKQNGVTYVTDAGITRIKDFAQGRHTRVLTREPSVLIPVLQRELKAKERQLEVKDQQIAILTASLTVALETVSNAQKLHAMEVKLLADKLESVEPKPGFFSRLFHKSVKMSQGNDN